MDLPLDPMRVGGALDRVVPTIFEKMVLPDGATVAARFPNVIECFIWKLEGRPERRSGWPGVVDLEQNAERGPDGFWSCFMVCSSFDDCGDLRWAEGADGLEVRWIEVRPPLPLKRTRHGCRKRTARM